MGPIFIFASGQRTGSTLLQRFLSTNENIIIWGEHNGVLSDYFLTFDKLMDWQEEYSHHLDLFLNKGLNNFIANMTPPYRDISYAKKELVRSLWEYPAHELGREIWGFKEVRYDANMALQLKELFPDCKVIHLTRNIKDCFLSLLHWERFGGWSRDDTLEFIQTWMRVNESFLDLMDHGNQSWIMSITYEKLTRDSSNITKKLVHWLGFAPESFDRDVFKYKIYTERYNGDDNRKPINFHDLPMSDKCILKDIRIKKILGRFDIDDSWMIEIGL